MKHSYSKFILIFIVSTILFVLGACSSNSELKTGNKEEGKTTSWERIKDKGTLTVGTSGTLYPTSYHDSDSNELTGFEVEVVKEMAKRLNLEVKFVEMAFDGMLTSINSGAIDIAANDISITAERKEKFAFSSPYKFSFASAIVRKDDLSSIKTVEDIKGKKAAGEATTVYMDIARKYGAEEVIYDNATNESYLRDVDAGRTDLIINDYYLQLQALEFYPDLNITIHPDLKFETPSEGVGMIMKKDATELQKNIDDTLHQMLKDETISKLSKQYFSGHDVTEKPDLQY
ncbi:transporter substrate-binding domain-containing protein [Bacillus andreraoultii]|uniref:transporter substrate-binding domain-containing protein n=1 Tax=Bacillus andreraoultii TaxID=1499685 RepID=UPI00053B71A1|nr:transporter substrate-binding domain-containing protein [Bacillus andreraoultii]